jgi:protein-disulfide isomerase
MVAARSHDGLELKRQSCFSSNRGRACAAVPTDPFREFKEPMRPSVFLACAVAVATLAGSLPAHAATATSSSAKKQRAKPVQVRDWTEVVSSTPAGGFVMGNPKAKVKLVEFGSMTCPHCREFDQLGVPHLIQDYVKSGEVSWEFRNYVRDAFDVTASLIARCNGPKSFFPLTRALYKDQEKWVTKVQQTPADKLEPLHDLPADREFVALAKIVGFQQWAAKRGLPVAKADRCLGNQASVEQLVAMAGDTMKQFPDFQGTPTFVINGTMVDLGPVTAEQVWPTLEGKIRAALSTAG